MANGSVRSIRILISRPERRNRTGADRIWGSPSGALSDCGVTSRIAPSRVGRICMLIWSVATSMRSISAVRKARWRGPGISRQLLLISAARDQPALRCRIGKPRRLIDAAGVAKPLAHSAAHELLYLARWNAQPGRPLGLILGDQRARDIIAVTHALLDGVGRRHSVASAIKQYSGKQARLASSCAGVALGGIGGALRLNRIPQRRIDDRRVLARMGLPLVNDLAEISAVLQYQIERTAREWLAASQAT